MCCGLSECTIVYIFMGQLRKQTQGSGHRSYFAVFHTNKILYIGNEFLILLYYGNYFLQFDFFKVVKI